MSLSSLAGSLAANGRWTATKNLVGTPYNPITNQNTVSATQNYTSATANNAAGGADELVSYYISIAAGASATVDLTSLTDILGAAGVALARVKGYQLRLLSVADDATYGTLASSVTVGNTGAALANGAQLDFGVGTGLTLNVTAAAGAITVVAIVVAGTGYPRSSTFLVAVIQSTATAGLVAVTTNSSGVPTAVALVSGGAGYTTATPLATFVAGFYNVKNGGSHTVFDQTDAGYLVSATSKNIQIQNGDNAVACYVQLTIFGGTT